MKINAIYLHRKDIKKVTHSNNLIFIIILLCLAIISAVIIYVIFYEKINSELYDIFINSFNGIISKSKPVVLTDLLLSDLLFHLIMIISSTSIYGDYIISILLFFRVSGLSLLLSFVYFNFSLKGIEYAFLVLLPGKMIYLLSLILMVETCHLTVGRIKEKNKDITSKELIVMFGVSIIIMLFSAVADYAFNSLFSGLFDF